MQSLARRKNSLEPKTQIVLKPSAIHLNLKMTIAERARFSCIHPIDKLRVNQSFVKDLPDEQDASIAR